MRRNVGMWDRALRGVASAAMIGGAFLAPVPPLVRAGLLGTMGAYMLFTSLSGTCLGYRLMGYSTCPLESRK